MPDSLSLTITADTSKLQSQLAIGQASLRQFNSEAARLASAFNTASDAAKGEVLASLEAVETKITSVRAANAALTAQIRDVGGFTSMKDALDSIGISSRAATTGAARLAEELGRGNLAGAGAHIAHMAIEMASANPLFFAGAAAIAAVAGAAYLASERFGEWEAAIRSVTGALAQAGDSGTMSEASIKSWIGELSSTFNLSTKDAAGLAATFASLGTLTEAQKKQVADLSGAYSNITGTGIDKAQQEVAAAFRGGAEGALRLGEQLQALDSSQIATMESDVRLHDAEKARADLMDALTAKYGPQVTQLKAYTRALQDAASEPLSGQAISPVGAPGAPVTGPKSDTSTYDGLQKLEAQTEITIARIHNDWQLSAAARASQEQQAWAKVVDYALAGGTALANAAKEAAQKELSAFAGLGQANASDIEKQYQFRAASIQADPTASEEQKASRLAALYQQEANDARLSAEVRADAARSAVRAEGDAANQSSASIMRAYQEASAAAREGSSERLEADMAAFDYAAMTYGKLSPIAVAAFKAMTASAKAYQDTQQEINQQVSENAIAVSRVEMEAKKASLQAQVDERKISVTQEVAALKQLEDQDYQSNLAMLQNRLSTLTQGTKEWQAAYGQIEVLTAQHDANLQKLDLDLASNQKQIAQQYGAAMKSVFEEIESTASSAMSTMLEGQKNWRQQASQEIDRLLVKWITDLAEMAAQFAAFEAATVLKWTQMASAIDPFGSGSQGMAKLVGGALGLGGGSSGDSATQSLVTAITGQTAATVQNTSGVTSWISTQLQSIGQFLGLTTATATATTTTAGGLIPALVTLTSAVVANTIAQGAGSITSLGGSMSWASDTLGEIGGAFPFLGAFDTGTMDVPETGLALLHGGEIVLPKEISDVVRGGGSIGSGIGSFGGATGGSSAGGAVNVNLSVSAIDPGTGADFLIQQSPRIAKQIAQQVRLSNASLRTAFGTLR
jgi:hypothetical protein